MLDREMVSGDILRNMIFNTRSSSFSQSHKYIINIYYLIFTFMRYLRIERLFLLWERGVLFLLIVIFFFSEESLTPFILELNIIMGFLYRIISSLGNLQRQEERLILGFF